MFEIDLARKLCISLDDVYKLEAQLPQLFDAFEEMYLEHREECEEIIYAAENLDDLRQDYDHTITLLNEDISNLQKTVSQLKQLLEENGIDYD